MDKIQTILLQKFQEQKLAHFYLLSPARQDQKGELNQWVHEFLQALTSKNISNHPDILLIDSDPEKKSYKWEDLSGVYKFLNHAPLEWPQKIIYIADAHKITEVVANKLLKVLEEPPIACTFLITNPLKKSLLHTIESRAIHLHLPLSKAHSKNDIDSTFLEDTCSLSLHLFIEKLKSDNTDPSLESQVIEHIIAKNTLTLSQVKKLIHHAKIFKEDQTFYNSPQYRLVQLFSAISSSSER